ncbi:MAG: DmsC/YnfH family molybdoenzyme membrane anchor subunit [Polyangiales bacterium]
MSTVVRLPLIQQYLLQQRELTAVERFSREHDAHALDTTSARYRDLIPLSKPQAGQQYAFSVDLDRCTGCKACVAACHSLNGLDEGESWRAVGLLHGGSPEQPVQQTVTSACHHCVDPACMNGCPVNAYEKDAQTGIVKHLDDQCIGCKYCTLTCPYEVPQYNERKGIVRKCDMCSDRLKADEAPACVQACPNEAIRIEIVSTRQVLEDAQGDAFLPAAPSPGITVPTTSYKTERALPRNLLPADFYSVKPSEQHRPLVVMLVLTQLSVGAFCVDLLGRSLGATAGPSASRFVHAAFALVFGLLALGASSLHLGRPLYAFRAVLGLRRSWLSREIIGFSVFAALAFAYASFLGLAHARPAVLDPSLAPLETWLPASVALTGLGSVFCSAMLYHVTLRRFWSFSRSGFKFFATTALLGLSATFTTTLAAQLAAPMPTSIGFVRALWVCLASAFGLKLLGELSVLGHLRDKQQTELKRSALLLKGELAPLLQRRILLGVVGAVLLPCALIVSAEGGVTKVDVAVAVFALVLTVLGELHERVLFFAAVSAAKMPGALR